VATVRVELAELLEAQLVGAPTVAVLRHPSQLDPPAVSTVMLRLDKVSPGVVRGHRAYTFALVLLAGSSAVDGADVELEALVDRVLAALDTFDPALALTWAEGTRGVYRSTIPAFEIPITVHVAVT
jgi:hypothetical protein